VADQAAKHDKREVIPRTMPDLVVEGRLEDAPIAPLAGKSGASPGVIYHYFASKNDLIDAVYERVLYLYRRNHA
jgi:TetR/AcrR family transcriptional regulator, repressor of fatR-cypB operon